MLPDILRSELMVVFCGTAAGNRSAREGAYYAHPTNKFWRTLAEVSLTPRLLFPKEADVLPEFGIGLTDLAKGVSGVDADIPESAYKPSRLIEIARLFQPKIIAFNGKGAARRALGLRVNPPLGPIEQAQLPGSACWVLPSTSGSASAYWDQSAWTELAEFVAASKREPAGDTAWRK